MLDLDAAALMESMGAVRTFNQILVEGYAHRHRTELFHEGFRSLESHVRYLRDVAEKLGIGAAKVAADDFLTMLCDVPEVNGRRCFELSESYRYRQTLDGLGSSLHYGLSGQICILLGTSEASLFSPTEEPFGDEVALKFGDACDDIYEACKCLALGRGTAAVFHLMRVLEAAMTIVAAKLGAPIVDANGKGLPWGVIAQNMKAIIDRMTPGSDEQIRWYRVQHDLVVVNRAWRVPTAHPKQVYTPEEARGVFDAVKTFMKELVDFA